MNIEELTKSQIFLLTLLTSFVTSIATGIVTVALLDQAPPIITQSVNRVIRETVEKTAPSKAIQATVAAVSVPLKEEEPTAPKNDLTAAIARATPSIVRIYTVQKDHTFLSFGIVLNAAGIVATDNDAILGSGGVSITFSDGASVAASIKSRHVADGFVYLALATTTPQTSHYTPATLSIAPKELGQTVISFVGKSSPHIASGLVVALMPARAEKTAPDLIDTNIPAGSIAKGTPLIDETGAIIGISTGASRAIEASAFMPTSQVTTEDTSVLLDLKKGRN